MISMGPIVRASVGVGGDGARRAAPLARFFPHRKLTRHCGAGRWGLVTYTDHASAVKACEASAQAQWNPLNPPPWPTEWLVQLVTKQRLVSLEAMLIAESHDMSEETYRLSQER